MNQSGINTQELTIPVYVHSFHEHLPCESFIPSWTRTWKLCSWIQTRNIFTARSELCKVLFMATSVCRFLLAYEISWEPLNRFASKSDEDVWSLARMSLKVKVKGSGHQGQKWHFSALLAACVQFMFGKTLLILFFCYSSMQ